MVLWIAQVEQSRVKDLASKAAEDSQNPCLTSMQEAMTGQALSGQDSKCQTGQEDSVLPGEAVVAQGGSTQVPKDILADAVR